MCGIAGFLTDGSDAARPDLSAMVQAIYRRGPDGSGTYVDESTVGLGMRRLAIIDVEGGNQPIFNEDRSVVVVFNGEIYNHQSLRRELEQRGHTLATHSDTEVIVHLYEDFGPRFAEHLDGMFGIALWDIRKKRLLLCRDSLGIKPLFVAKRGRTVLFGSEIKSILASGLVDRSIDPLALDCYMSLGYTTGPATLFSQIERVPPGVVFEFGPQAPVCRHEFRRPLPAPEPQLAAGEAEQLIESQLRDAVRSHLVSDVPIGALLSGGIDSGLVVAFMAESCTSRIETFNVHFVDSGGRVVDERGNCRSLAERYSLNHHEIPVKAAFEPIAPELIAALDEPLADDGIIPSYYVSQATRQHVKVALSGLGGDELFAGYKRHLGVALGSKFSFVPPALARAAGSVMARLLPEHRFRSDVGDHIVRQLAAMGASGDAGYMPYVEIADGHHRQALYSRDMRDALRNTPAASSELFARLSKPLENLSALERCLRIDSSTYLPDDVLAVTDRMSMWHSLELRVPFLALGVVEAAARLPSQAKIHGKTQKATLRHIAERWLPEGYLTQRKQGFEAPMSQWLRGPLIEYFRRVMSPAALARVGLIEPQAIHALLEEHVSGRRKHSRVLFAALLLQLWAEANGRPSIASRSQLILS